MQSHHLSPMRDWLERSQRTPKLEITGVIDRNIYILYGTKWTIKIVWKSGVNFRQHLMEGQKTPSCYKPSWTAGLTEYVDGCSPRLAQARAFIREELVTILQVTHIRNYDLQTNGTQTSLLFGHPIRFPKFGQLFLGAHNSLYWTVLRLKTEDTGAFTYTHLIKSEWPSGVYNQVFCLTHHPP